MSKNIIILSDGTGNGAAKSYKTNVWRLYDALDLHRDDQIACFDDGVGSQEFLPLKILGGACGYGLKRNIRELYKFLCRTYQDGDRIYLFGFSRGAYTVRLLAGMIEKCGVYQGYADEQELDRGARANYNVFRRSFKNGGLLTRKLRTFWGRNDRLSRATHTPKIEFIGVWDTVDAYGLPIDELAQAWHYLIYPIYFPDYKLSTNVKRACHALSVDDERRTFHPLLWDEKGEKDPGRIEQVWFPGVHSDVGGGYPEYTMALVTLDWMIDRVEVKLDKPTAQGIPENPTAPGIHFIAQCREEIRDHSDWHGPQHDSRAGAGAYYRYSPRDIATLCHDKKKEIHIAKPKIHRGVFERIQGNATAYAPTGLPEHYEVVATRGARPEFETAEERRARKVALAPIRKMIFWRKRLYDALVLTSIGFFLAPLPRIFGWISTDQCPPAGGIVDRLLVLAMNFLPDFVAPWINFLRYSPATLYGLIVLLTIFFLAKRQLWLQTQDIAMKAWAALKKRLRLRGK